MSTALSYSKYYSELEEVKIYNASSNSRSLSKLVTHYNGENELGIEERKLRNANIYELKVKLFEDRIALFEGGVEAVAVNSFLKARRVLLSNIAGPGDNIITINSTSLLFDKSITREENIEVRNAYDGKLSNLERLLDKNTKAVYIETVSSDYSIPDFLKISAFAKTAGIPLIVDNTHGKIGFVSTPLKNGANIIISNTAEIFKTSDPAIGAVIVDGGNFDWEKDKFSQFLGYDNFYKSSIERNFIFVNFLRTQFNENYSDVAVNESIVTLLNELETFHNDFKKESTSALNLAKLLSSHPFVKEVQYNGLPSSDNYLNALRYFRNGFGNHLRFSLSASENVVRQFVLEIQRRRFLFNNWEKDYKIIFNSTDLSIEVIVQSASFEAISQDFNQALNDVFSTESLKSLTLNQLALSY